MMNVLVFGLAALLAADLARRTRGLSSRDAAAVLYAGVPRALLPPAAAITLGAWPLRTAFEDVARMGSGGPGNIVPVAANLADLALAGAIACVLVLAFAFVLVWRARARPSGDEAAAAELPPGVAAAIWLRGGAIVVAAAFIAYGFIVAERVATLAVAPVAERLAVPIQIGWASRVDGSMGETLAGLGRLITELTTGGTILCLVLLIQIISTGSVVARRRVPARLQLLFVPVALAMVVVAAWRAVHLSAAVGWLSAVLARLPS